MRIGTSILSLLASRRLSDTTKAIARSMERLASGKRIVSARDDAAGISIAASLENQKRGTAQGNRNIHDAFGFLSTADGALSAQSNLIQKMRELALQAANGTLTTSDRDKLNTEFAGLLEEFNRLTSDTRLNNTNLIDGSFGTKSIQVGSRKGDTISINLESSQATDIFYATVDLDEPIGAGTFTFNKTYSTTSSQPVDVTSGDINGDGHIDVITASIGSSLSVYLGNGDGTLGAASSLTSNAPQAVGLSDVDGDGDLDIVASQLFPAANYGISIYLNNGNGTFATRTTMPSDGTGTSNDIEIEDFNGDGNKDVVMVNRTANSMGIYFGNGNGTFASAITWSTTSTPNELGVSDLNEDGNLDIVITSGGSGLASIYLGNGNGTFQSSITLSTSFATKDVSIADFNGDGHDDLIFSSNSSSQFSIHLGNGNGTFQARTTLNGHGSVSGDEMIAHDSNSDGNLDIIVTNSGSNFIGIYYGTGSGTFTSSITFAATGVQAIDMADLDEDGVDDLIAPNYAGGAGNTVAVYFADTADTLDLTSEDLSLETQEAAANTLALLETALEEINSRRANIGALHNRLEFAESNNLSLLENISSAQSDIQDLDYAEEMAEFTRLQIMQQAGISVLSQANLSTRLALELLKLMD